MKQSESPLLPIISTVDANNPDYCTQSSIHLLESHYFPVLLPSLQIRTLFVPSSLYRSFSLWYLVETR